MNTILQKVLYWLASRIMRKYRPQVVGITGSVGKTSTKEAVALVLGKHFNVRESKKNYNNEIGVPLTIIGVDKSPGSSLLGWLAVFLKGLRLLILRDVRYPATLVLEMGADKPGDIAYLTKLAPCQVGVLTFISHAHTEFFKTIQNIALEKQVIISHLKPSGFAILNYDNSYVMEQVKKTKAQVITYGFKEGADLRATDLQVLTSDDGSRPIGFNFKINFQGSSVPVFLPDIISSSVIPATLAAVAVGQTFGINLLQAVEALRSLKPLPGHMRALSGIKKTLLIDDTYNSSPAAAKSALTTLSGVALKEAGAEYYAVLGDMLELGGETESAHREIGHLVAELGIHNLITVGAASKITAEAAIEAGLPAERVVCFDDSVEAGKYMQQKIQTGDVVLIKGSQGSRMEKIVKEIMAEPLRAGELLVRQEATWLR